MCAIEGSSPYIWTIYEKIPENRLTDDQKRFGITHERMSCGDFSSEERAKMWLDNARRAKEHPENFKVEKHMLDYLLRCH
jgi:hypothetical protein